MSTQIDKYNNPTNMKDGTDLHVEDYKYMINYGANFSYKKSTRDRSANFNDTMNMIDILLAQYEMIYQPHDTDKNLLLFSNLFKKPNEDVKIKNKQTGEIYNIEDVIVDPVTKLWEGLIKISSVNPPDLNKSEKLEFLRPQDSLVRFTHDSPISSEIVQQADDGQIIDSGPIKPTVTYSLIRKEPGTIGKTPFHPSKEYKPRRRELLKKPDGSSHSVEIYGQLFDQLVQFDTWTVDHFSAEKLADWFEKFMKLYVWVLKLNGVQEILFWQRLRDAAVTKWRQDLVSRTLQYFIRTEDLEPVIRKNLVNFDMSVNTKTDLSDLSEAYIAEQVVKSPGKLTHVQYQNLFRNSAGKYMFGDLFINDDGP